VRDLPGCVDGELRGRDEVRETARPRRQEDSKRDKDDGS
jgi:hypothetical protein